MEETTMDIKLSESFIWKNMKITPISYSKLQSFPSLKYFITDQNRSAIIPFNTDPLFRFSNLRAAKTFNCSFPSNNCVCINSGELIKCDCLNFNLENLLEGKNALPTIVDKTFLSYNEQKIIAETEMNSLQLQITIKNLQIKAKVENNKCDMKFKSLIGCFRCQHGEVRRTLELPSHALIVHRIRLMSFAIPQNPNIP